MISTTGWQSNVSEPLQRVLDRVIEFSPSIVGAVALVLIGWIVAVILRGICRRLAQYGLDRLRRFSSFRSSDPMSQSTQRLPGILAVVVFWIVLIFFIAAAIEALGLQVVSDILNQVTTYLPQVLVAVIIVFVGLFFGEVARNWAVRAAGRTGIAFADLIGRCIQAVIIVVAIMIAVDQVGVESTVLVMTLAIAVGAAFGATALAFGLGAGPIVSNILAAHYVHRSYHAGQVIRIGELQGSVVEVTRTAVVLDTKEGKVQIPARRFIEDVSVLVSDS